MSAETPDEEQNQEEVVRGEPSAAAIGSRFEKVAEEWVMKDIRAKTPSASLSPASTAYRASVAAASPVGSFRTSPSPSSGLSPSAKIVSRESQLRVVFNALDLDSSGVINVDVFKSLAVVRTGSSWQKQRTERLMTKVDRDQQGIVTEAEFIQFFSASLAGEKDEDFEAKIQDFRQAAAALAFQQVDGELGGRLQAIFVAADTDGDGFVEKSDLEAMRLVPPEMSVSLEELETDGNGSVTFQGLAQFMASRKAIMGQEAFDEAFAKMAHALPLTDSQVMRIQAIFSAFQSLQNDGARHKHVTIDKHIVDTVAGGMFGTKLSASNGSKLSLEDFTGLCRAIKREKGTEYLEEYLADLESSCDLNSVQIAKITCIFKALDEAGNGDAHVSVKEIEALAGRFDSFFRGLKASMSQNVLLAEDASVNSQATELEVGVVRRGVTLDEFIDYFGKVQNNRGVLHVNNKIERFADHASVKAAYEKFADQNPLLSGNPPAQKRGCGACTIS